MSKHPRKPSKWTKFSMPLKEDHGWKCKPGYLIFVADRGAVRFDYPKEWIVRPHEEDGTIRFHDCEPPDDNVRLTLSVLYLRDDVDWSKLSMRQLLQEITDKRRRDDTEYGPVHEVRNPRQEVAWSETSYPDPENGRLVKSRTAIGRYSNIQIVMTYDFYADLSARFGKVWDEILRTLVLGDYVEDPTQRIEVDPIDDLFA